MEQNLKIYDTDQFYEQRYKITSDFKVPSKKVEEEEDGSSLQVQDSSILQDDEDCSAVSTYLCHKPLMTLCEKLSKGVFEVQLCVLAANSVPGKALDLGTLDGSISSLMKDAAEKYKADFPPVVFETPAHKVQYSTDLEVLTSKVVVDESDYRHQLATFNTAAQQHEDASISEYINHRIVLIADALAVDTSIADKLKKVSILQEKKRKLVTYEVAIDGQLPWNVIKKRRFNVFSGAGPALDKERLDVTMKEVYSAVHNCDDDVLVVTCKLDTHNRANVVEIVKASLTANGISKKHLLVVGTVEQDTNETLARFKKGKKAFGARVEDKIVACSIRGFQDAVNGRMKFLPADTFFNRWPIPVLPVSMMAQIVEAQAWSDACLLPDATPNGFTQSPFSD